MNKYKAIFPLWGRKNPIEEVEVYRETDKFVIVKRSDGSERREAKYSAGWFRYFNTKDEAKDFLVSSSEQEVTKTQNALIKAKEDFEFIKSL
jgi:hypothetical protein